MQFYVLNSHKKLYDDFFRIYQIEEIIDCDPSVKISGLKPKGSRVCRFCGKKSGETTFKKDAHVIPESLGNRNWVSDFECDKCNSQFGVFENNLAAFMGITRTLGHVKGKNKIPTFKSPDGKITARHSTEDVNVITIVKNDVASDAISVNPLTGATTIKYKDQPYIPLAVYKAFVKMALSCLPEKYLNEYALAFEYLLTNKYDADFKMFTQIENYTFPNSYAIKYPIVVLCKKRSANEVAFTHVFQLYYQNYVFQFPIPLNIQDMRFINKSVPIYSCPPLLTDADVVSKLNIDNIPNYIYDLSSAELLKDYINELVIPSSPEAALNEFGTELENARKATDVIAIEIIREPFSS